MEGWRGPKSGRATLSVAEQAWRPSAVTGSGKRRPPETWGMCEWWTAVMGKGRGVAGVVGKGDRGEVNFLFQKAISFYFPLVGV